MDDQLKQLFDYTKFHIGLYTTLLAGIIGVFANDALKNAYSGMVPYIQVTIVLFLVAGAAGGASSISFFKTCDEFSRAHIGPWKTKLIPSITCTHIEHTAFWLGCLVAAYGLFMVLST